MAELRGLVLRLDRLLGRVEAFLLAVMVAAITAVTFAQVFTRYVLSDPWVWTEEAARYLFVWITLVGAAAAVRTRGHFGLDILRRYAPPLRAPLGLLTMLVVAAFLGLLFYTGVIETKQASTQLSPAIGFNMHWAYLAIPFGAALALWHLVAHWVEAGIGAHPLDAAKKPGEVSESEEAT